MDLQPGVRDHASDAPRVWVLDAADNVGTALNALAPGPVLACGVEGSTALRVTEPVPTSHKVALSVIASGGDVIKHGVPIGRATQAIAAGAHVHLHNCASKLDERSSQYLDAQSGAPTDTPYV